MQLQPISPATIWLLLKTALMVDPLNIEHRMLMRNFLQTHCLNKVDKPGSPMDFDFFINKRREIATKYHNQFTMFPLS
jgi:hypothetical protein